MKRRIVSIITALALCLSLCPTWAFAVEGEPDTGLCDHHPEHIGCGYVAPTEGQPCGHEHTEDCYTTDEAGGEVLDCQHSHDSDCGYVQADPGAPCGYVCRICPIEALIAALPEQVTEDNAADVRAQLDRILGLYRELDEGEQEEIDLSRVTALQGALDAANTPMTADGRTEQQDTDVASVTIGETTTYYSNIETAWNAANSNTATVTLLSNVTGTNTLDLTGGNVTLNCGGHTLRISRMNFAIKVTSGSLTVENGTVENPEGNVIGILDTADLLIVKETATITVSKTFAGGIHMPDGDGKGSTVKFYGKIQGDIPGGMNCIGIYLAKGTLEVYPGAEISCNGGTSYTGIYTDDGTTTVKLYGGTFSSDKGDAIDCSAGKVTDLLPGFGDNTAETHYAYYDGDDKLITDSEKLNGKTLTGTVTVKACTHTGEGVCTYTHNENTSTHTKTCLACGNTWEAEGCDYGEYTHNENTSTHTKTCLACGNTWEAEDCDYGEYTHNDTSHTRICKLCGYQNVEAHNIKCTAEASGTVIAVSEACKTCGYGKDLGTVTIHIPKLVYGDLTGVVTAENTLTEPVSVAGNVKNPRGETVIFSDHAIIDPPTMATLTGNALLSAGEHKIKINIVIIRDENALAECELTFNVTPAPLPEVTLSAESATYSGTEQKPALSVQQGETALTEGTDYEVSYTRDGVVTNDFTNAGTVNITVTGKGNYTGSVEKTYTIGKATPTIAWANNVVTLTYTGQPADIKPVVTLVNGETFSGTITYHHTNTDSSESGESKAGLPTNAGIYGVGARIPEQDNYTAATTAFLMLMINKADQTVPAAPTADEENIKDTSITLDTIENAEYKRDDGEWQDSPVFTDLSPNTPYTFYARLKEDANHNASPDSAAASITTKKTMLNTAVVTVSGTYTYTGAAIVPEAGNVEVVLNGTKIDSDQYTISATGNVNAGTAKLTVTATENGSYSGSASTTFTISPATPALAWSSTTQELAYTGSAATITAPTVTLVGSDTFSGTITHSHAAQGGTEFKDGLPTNAGTYTVKASIAAQGNYTAAESTNTLALTIKPSPVTLTFNNQTITYGGTPTGATASPASAEIKYSYTTEADGTPISGWPTNAGTYTVTAKVEATGNYGGASQTATLTINPKEVSNPTIELSPSSFDYDGTAKKPAVTVKDGTTVIPASEYTVAYSNNINAGTATVTITDKTGGNYTVSGTTTFTITAKPLTGAKVEATGTFTYTGNAQEPAPTVTLGGQPLTANTDYTVTYDDNTNAGTAKITVTGTGNYSGTAQGTFTIGRADLTADGTGIASGTYGDKLSGLTVSGLTAKLGEATVTGTWKLTGDTVPNVGDSGQYTATFTPATGAGNYNALTAQVTLNIAKANYTGTTTASTSAKFGTTGTYDLSALLPDGATAGTAATTSDIFEGTPTVSGKALTYQLKEGATVGNTGPITVPVISTNYQEFNLTITVTVTDKFVPTLTVSPITVTYSGEAIPGTAIKGTAKVGSTTVPGTWAFASGEAVTNVADSGTKTVKFVPTDKATYAEATAVVVVTIGKATPTGAPKYTAISASGKTLADAGLTTEGGTFSTTGTVAWALGTDTAVTANTQYEWTFTPTDAANYNTLTGKITLWVQSTGGGSYVPSGPSSPGTSTLPVTTTGQGSSTTTTTTTAAPTANTQGGTATTTINTTMGQEIVKQAVANKSEEVVIAPKVTGSVTKAEVSIPASTVGQIGSQTSASLTVSTPVADVTIPNGGLGSLGSAGGTVTVTAEQIGNQVELTVTAGGQTVQTVPGGVTLTVPASNTTPGTVAVLVRPDGTRQVVRKSVADGDSVTIPLDGSAKLEIVDNSGYFADVPATSWAADAVAFASGHELFSGTAPGQFSPNTPMSRGMLAVVLHNLESNPAQALTGAFIDVDNSQWYAEGVAWAEAQGIIGGYGNGQFGPNDNITREQLAVMLWRYAGSPAATDRELHFADAHRASDWALEALRWATENGIINGKGGGILDPTGQATRAETAQMLKNFMESK